MSSASKSFSVGLHRPFTEMNAFLQCHAETPDLGLRSLSGSVCPVMRAGAAPLSLCLGDYLPTPLCLSLASWQQLWKTMAMSVPLSQGRFGRTQTAPLIAFSSFCPLDFFCHHLQFIFSQIRSRDRFRCLLCQWAVLLQSTAEGCHLTVPILSCPTFSCLELKSPDLLCLNTEDLQGL